MKRLLSIVLAVLLMLCTLCGCEENPQRATCTISASNGFTTVKCAFECTENYSSTWFAINTPTLVTFEEPGYLSYEFTCPACSCTINGKINSGNSVFLRCNCEKNPQAIVISAVFAEIPATPSELPTESLDTPKYELEG